MAAKRKKPAPAKSKKTKKTSKASPAPKKPTACDLELERRQADEAALAEYYRRIKSGEKLKPFEHAHRREIEERLDRANADPATGDVLPNAAALMEYAGWSKASVSYHITKGNIRQNPDGSFDKAVIDAYFEKKNKGNGGRVKPAPSPEAAAPEPGACESLDEQAKRADLRWRNARAEKEEILTKQIRGTMFSKADVLTEWTERVVAVASGLEALADRLPPLLAGLDPKEMQSIIKNEVRLLREAFARDGKYTPEAGE